jgi:GAF domain-containing protein
VSSRPGRPPADPAALRLERLERLQGLTEALSAAATSEEVARTIFELGLALVDASAVTLFWERVPGELELRHAVGVSEDFAARYGRVHADEPLPMAEAYRDAQAVWLRSPEEIAARFPMLVPIVTRERVEAWAALPLPSGAPRGAVGLQFGTPRAFDGEERAFVLAAVRQCAQAIERARLFDAHRRLAERLQHVQLTAAALSVAATPREVAVKAFRALGAVGACAAEIHALRRPDAIVLLARYGRTAEGEGVEGTVTSVDSPAPAAEVVRTGRALWLESPEEIAGRYPHLEAERARRGEGAWVAVPLLASGKALGALTIAFPSPRHLEGDERTFVRLVAQPCAAALERAQVFEAAGRSRAEAEWTTALLGATLDAAPMGLALLDRDMRFVHANEAFAQLDGVPVDAHLARTPRDILPGVAGEQLAEVFRTVLATGRAVERDVVGETRAAPGATGRFETSAYPVRVDGNLVGVGILVRGRT